MNKWMDGVYYMYEKGLIPSSESILSEGSHKLSDEQFTDSKLFQTNSCEIRCFDVFSKCKNVQLCTLGQTDGWMDWMNDRKGASALEQVTRLPCGGPSSW